jgi:hypothetical protein
MGNRFACPSPNIKRLRACLAESGKKTARRTNPRGGAIIGDLTELPSCFEIMESPLVELLLQSYRLVVGGRSLEDDKSCSVSFTCRYCQGKITAGNTPEVQGTFLWNYKSDDTTFFNPGSLLQHVQQHCTKIPPHSTFLTQQEPNANDQLQMEALLKHWKSYLIKEILPRERKNMEKIPVDGLEIWAVGVLCASENNVSPRSIPSGYIDARHQ